VEVVSDLRQYASPVDAVDSRQTVRTVDLWVGEECFDDILLMVSTLSPLEWGAVSEVTGTISV